MTDRKSEGARRRALVQELYPHRYLAGVVPVDQPEADPEYVSGHGADPRSYVQAVEAGSTGWRVVSVALVIPVEEWA